MVSILQKGERAVRKGMKQEEPAEAASFGAIYRCHYPQLVRHLTFLLGEKAVAEEVAQETFLKLFTSAPPELRNPGGWLYQVANRLAFNHLRAEKRRRAREAAAVTDPLNTVVPFEENVLRQETVLLVRRVLAGLPPRDRVALLMRQSGYDYRQIAAAIGVAPGSVGTILARAQKRFVTLYQEEKGGAAGEMP